MADSPEVRVMVAGRFMEGIRHIDHRADRLNEEVHRLVSELGIHGQTLEECIAKTGYVHGLEQTIAEYNAAVEDYNHELRQMLETRRAVHGMLDNLAPLHAQVLAKYYLHKLTWDQVAHEMDYSRQRIMELRRAALNALYDFIPEEHRRVLPKAI